MFVLVSNELITKLGMYVLLPIFIAFLFLSCLIFPRKQCRQTRHIWIFGTGRRFLAFLSKWSWSGILVNALNYALL